MPFAEVDLLPISALQHLLFCERQCALIHIEQVWAENRFTAEGRQFHRKAHEGGPETRSGTRITRGLPLRSLELGLTGQADIITWQPPAGVQPVGRTLAEAVRGAGREELARWSVTLVEYKRGQPKKNDCDRVQLCAQALCLEEMLGLTLQSGDLFYGLKRRRIAVEFAEPLRSLTRETAVRLHELMAGQVTPRARREKKCETCSLLPLCLPDAADPARSARRFLDRSVAAHLDSAGPDTDPDPGVAVP